MTPLLILFTLVVFLALISIILTETYFPSWLLANPGWDRVSDSGYIPSNYRNSPTLTKEYFRTSGIPDGNKYLSLYPGSRWRGMCNPTTPQCPVKSSRPTWYRNWFMTSSSPFLR